MGFAAMAVDAGYLEYRQRQQQSAADAAAIGGAQQLAYTGCNDQSAATTTADADAATNGFPDETSSNGPITVKVTNPPQSGPYANNNCAVDVTINNTNTQTFFSRIFGYNQMKETTEAVAASESNGNGCAYLLGTTATDDFHGAKISAAACGLLINGSPTFDGGEIDFLNIGYAGSLTTHGTKWDAAEPEAMLPVADPCPEIAGCRALSADPPATSGCGAATVTNGAISPGCYSGISGNQGFSTMQPGMYVFTGPISLTGGNLTGNGVTIYVADGGSFSMSGVTATLSACTTSCTGSGNYVAVPNVLYYQPSSNPNQITISGPPSSYSGLIYAPAAPATFNGNAGTGYTVVVFNSWTLNGTGQGMTFAAPPQGGSFIPKAVLVQ